MEKSLCILGRAAALGMAELESLYGAEMVRPVGSQAAIINHNYKDINFARLGGSMRLCEVLDILDTFKWPEIEKHILTTYRLNYDLKRTVKSSSAECN